MIRRIESKKRIRDFCRRDSLRYVFHLGDLDDAEWHQSHYYAIENDGKIDEIALVYLGLSVPSVQLFGKVGSLGRACLDFIPVLPEEFHLHCHNEDIPLLERDLEFGEGGELYRMLWRGFPKGMKNSVFETRMIGPAQLKDLVELLEVAFPDTWFEPHQLSKAVFSGCYLDGRLVACAGFHVHSPREGVGALGSIATHPGFRGRGLAAAATIRLLEESREITPLLALNVQVTNTPALALYRKLGFEDVFRYRELSARQGRPRLA